MSPPHMSGTERERLLAAFDSNWIAPVGPEIDAFEREFAEKVQVGHAVAVASGTAAIHLSLRILGVKNGDTVLAPSFTFVATANPILYVGADPAFLDCDQRTWNLDPNLLEEELVERANQGRLPAAVVTVDVNGQCADYEPIRSICGRFEVPIVEDAAEALGATYHGTPAGGFGQLACFSFNGNKIITTSGGGMLVTENEEWAKLARYLATQARDPAPHYEHSQVGYNYRMSNLLAAIGRGQLAVLDQRVEKRRANFAFYEQHLGGLPGISFMPEPDGFRSTRWLSAILIDAKEFGADREQVRLALEEQNIESRPLWKPMHQQKLFQGCSMRGGSVSESLFEHGLCLPSGSSLTNEDLEHIIAIIKAVPK